VAVDRVRRERALDARLPAHANNSQCGVVLADDRVQRDLGAHRNEVRRDVRRTAERVFLATVQQHRDRRLGADALDRAVDVAVQHHVTDDDDAGGHSPPS
jgi:hypothetical protein